MNANIFKPKIFIKNEMTEIKIADYSTWNPKEYLDEYYSDIMSDEKLCLEFLIESLKKIRSVDIALDFGAGPIISHVLPLVVKAKEIHISEHLESNRLELQKWLADDIGAFDWRNSTFEVLRLESCPTPTEVKAQQREELVRQRVTQVLPGDVRNSDPLGINKRGFYPLVTAHYCAEGISQSKPEWLVYMKNIMSMVKPGGVLITSACGSGAFYRVGDLYFPSTKLEPQDVLSCFLNNGFMDVDIRVRQLSDHSEQGFFCNIFAAGVKLDFTSV
jgi:NNMT/PNMT/TEMT family